MNNSYKNLIFSLAILAASNGAMLLSSAQTTDDKDPARWYTEDTTPQAKYQTAKKEAGAALQESLAECKKMTGTVRAECMQEARSRFHADMMDAKDQLAR
jgi:hypothetical protein